MQTEMKAKHTPGPYWRNTTTTGHHVCGAHGKIIRRYPLTAVGAAASMEDVRRLQDGHVIAQEKLRDAAADLYAAAGLAITALSFEQERAERDGDSAALAQITQAKNALIAATHKADGRQPDMIDVTPRAAIAKAEGC